MYQQDSGSPQCVRLRIQEDLEQSIVPKKPVPVSTFRRPPEPQTAIMPSATRDGTATNTPGTIPRLSVSDQARAAARWLDAKSPASLNRHAHDRVPQDDASVRPRRVRSRRGLGPWPQGAKAPKLRAAVAPLPAPGLQLRLQADRQSGRCRGCDPRGLRQGLPEGRRLSRLVHVQDLALSHRDQRSF